MKLSTVLKRFSDFELLTDFEIKDVNISHVTVVDAPDATNYTRGEEFVLTSGYIFLKDDAILKKVLDSCKKQGCSALGIKLSRFLKTLPYEIIQYANKLKIPIINIPEKYAYSDIINPILSNILKNNIDEMHFTEKLHNEFTYMLVENKDIEEILNYLYKIIKIDFCFYDYFSNKEFYFGACKNKDGCFSRVIQGKTMKLGKIIVFNLEKNLSYTSKMAIYYCLTVLNIKIEQYIILTQIKERYLNDFVNDLLINNINSEEELFTRANLLKKDVNGNFFCIIFDIDNYKDTLINSPEKNSKLENFKNDTFKRIVEIFKSKNMIFHYYKKSDSIVFIVKENNILSNIKDDIIKPIKNYIYEIYLEYKKLTFTVGIGMVQKNILNISKSYNEAMDSIKIGRTLQNEDGIFIFKDIEFFKSLNESIEDEKSVPYFVKDFLNVVNYSKEKDSDYTKTLISLIENNWSIKKCAKNQFLHYNTIKYRYDKLQEITNKDFENYNDRFLLEFAYRYLKIKGNEI